MDVKWVWNGSDEIIIFVKNRSKIYDTSYPAIFNVSYADRESTFSACKWAGTVGTIGIFLK